VGRGAMGEVWRATDQVLGRPVAVKLLRTDEATDIERFRLEAQAAARLNHPNVVGVYDFGSLHGRLYLVMELVDGWSLAQERWMRGTLAPHEAAAIAAQVSALVAEGRTDRGGRVGGDNGDHGGGQLHVRGSVGRRGEADRVPGGPAWGGDLGGVAEDGGEPRPGSPCARPAGVTGTAGKPRSRRPRLAEQRVVREVAELRRFVAGCLRQGLCAGADPAEVAQRAGNSVEVLLSLYARCLYDRRSAAFSIARSPRNPRPRRRPRRVRRRSGRIRAGCP
jgi:hypothetical protein